MVSLYAEIRFFLTALILSSAAVQAQTRYDTTQPNEFYFTSDVYYVDEDATNAVIEVGFIPGNRSYSGSVDYRTADGTAVAGQDYSGTTNTLFFSGLAPTKAFTIPIQLDALSEGDETVQLSLVNPNALITRSSATLVIRNKQPRPSLAFSKSNSAVTLSWPASYTNCVLQKATGVATNWTNVPQQASVASGQYSVTMPITGNAFFRLSVSPSP